VANSVEMQEFLALNTDARIAFVKKPFIVSRIDKVRTPPDPTSSSSGVPGAHRSLVCVFVFRSW